MRCPRCGADNADRAARCYLCEYPFGDGATGEPPAPEGTQQACCPPTPGQAAPQPSTPPAGSLAPPSAGHYQPPPPGTYAAGPLPPPSTGKGYAAVKAAIAGLAVLLAVLIGVGAYFLLRGKSHSIVVSPPPGYEQAGQNLYKDLQKSIEASPAEAKVEDLFVDEDMRNFIIVVSMSMPFMAGEKPPSGDDPEELEQWFYDNEEEFKSGFASGIMEGATGMAEMPTLNVYEVEHLASGDAVLHMAPGAQFMVPYLQAEFLVMVKGGSTFLVMVMGLDPGADTVDELLQSTTLR